MPDLRSFISLIYPMLLSFIVCAVLTPLLIPFLKRLKFGQSILEIGPAWHMEKQGTPIMGGLAFIASTVAAVAVFARDKKAIIVLLCAIAFGLIGFWDDYLKVIKKQNMGLSAFQKSALQLLLAVIFIFSLKGMGMISTRVFIPFFGFSPELSWFYYPFAAFVIVGCVNAVNLTDGIDGLASSVTLPVMAFFAAAAIKLNAVGVGGSAAALFGGLCGFLIYNFHPAKVFMGDVGALFLGGAVCAMAFALDIPIILLFAGFIYVIEALSDILQVGYFKMTGGKRLFKMCPIHHHFEMSGWSENKIVAVFSFISAIMCLIGYFAL